MEEVIQELRRLNRTLEVIANDLSDLRRNTDLGTNSSILQDIYSAIPDGVHLGAVEDILDDIRRELHKANTASNLEEKIDALATQVRELLRK